MADYDDLPTFVIETRGGGGAGTFLLGALVGAAVALLLAPRSGTQTQAEIAGAVRRLRDDVGGRVSGARDAVSEQVGRARGRVSGAVDTVRDGVETRVGQVRAAVDAGRNAALDAREELQRRVQDAKEAYRVGLGGRAPAPGADGAAKGGELVVTEVATEEAGGDDLA